MSSPRLFSAALTIVLSGFAAAPTWAGPGSSGGGTGVFCPIWVWSQPRVQLLDFYQGKETLTIPESKEPYRDQVAKIAPLLSFDFSLKADFEAALKDVYANMKFMPKGKSIHVPQDLGGAEVIEIPTGCSLGGIGYYQADGKLLVSTDAFRKLSETQKAGFVVHEALYKVYRDHDYSQMGWIHFTGRLPDRSAAPTRKLVATLFANEKTPELLRKFSWPMTWSFWGIKEPSPWKPAEGQAHRFAYLHRGTVIPLLLDQRMNNVKIAVSNLENVEGRIQLRCTRMLSMYSSTDKVAESVFKPGDEKPRYAELDFDDNCPRLVIDVSIFSRPSDSKIEVFLNGQPLMNVDLDKSSYTSALGNLSLVPYSR